MDSYGKFVQKRLYPLWERKIRKRPILDYLDELLYLEKRPLAVLQELQAQRLRSLLTHASEHCAYYRKAFHEHGIQPGTIRSVTDLHKLPLLTRQLAKQSVQSRLSSSGPPIAVKKTTGGTTGEPLIIQYDQDSEYRRQAMRLRGFGWAGYQVGQRALHYWGQATKAKTSKRQRLKMKLDHSIKRELWIDCTPRGDAAKDEAIATIIAHQPEVIFCYAQALVELARYIIKTQSRAWRDITVICGAEKIYPDDRETLVKAFGPSVFETYGCREFMLIATECEAHQGLHLSMEHLIVEIVDDEGHPVLPGEVGHVVITDLFNYGSPFIRYQNGDMASMSKEETSCPCGRSHPRILSVEGRKTETLRDASGQPVGGMIINLIFSPMADEVKQFQCVQHKDDSITIKVVTQKALSETLQRHVTKLTRQYLPGVSINLQKVDSIPLTQSGKRRIVIVE